MQRALVLTLALAALAAGACTEKGSFVTSRSECITTKSADLSKKPEITIPDIAPPEELEVCDLVVGEGEQADAGPVEVQYVGVAWSTKREFDASWDRGRPFPFQLGKGDVILGWEAGVRGMRVGGRREIVIPPSMGYGERGAGGVIGPNETLVFVVDLVKIG